MLAFYLAYILAFYLTYTLALYCGSGRVVALWLHTTAEYIMKTLVEIMVKEPRTSATDSDIMNMIIASESTTLVHSC